MTQSCILLIPVVDLTVFLLNSSSVMEMKTTLLNCSDLQGGDIPTECVFCVIKYYICIVWWTKHELYLCNSSFILVYLNTVYQLLTLHSVK